MGIMNNGGDKAAGDWRQQWRLNCWGLGTAVEVWLIGRGGDTGDLAAEDWERRWRLSGWELETTVET